MSHCVASLFLSTPSARRATPSLFVGCSLFRNFYPRPPRGGRPRTSTGRDRPCTFLSTPSARRATVFTKSTAFSTVFLSTPSARRATVPAPIYTQGIFISIHALREEGDGLLQSFINGLTDFYPRPPRGGRLTSFFMSKPKQAFLSTPSARRATAVKIEYEYYVQFLSTPSARRATRYSI